MDDMMDLNKIFGIDKLKLNFPVRTEGIDGESFFYNIYFDNAGAEDKAEKIQKAIDGNLKPFSEEDDYTGYVEVSVKEGFVQVYHDIGGIEFDFEDHNLPIHEMLKAIAQVDGIQRVVINEGMEF